MKTFFKILKIVLSLMGLAIGIIIVWAIVSCCIEGTAYIKDLLHI